MTKTVVRHSGRARAVVVTGGQAVLTHITAQTATLGLAERIRFVGSAGFDSTTQAHLRTVVMPVVDQLRGLVGLSPVDFEIGVANLGATAQHNLTARITGFSADVPVLVAILSAGFGLHAADDIAATGHLSSVDGEIAAVCDLPAKIAALRRDRTVARFVHPDLSVDQSLAVLTPGQLQQANDAIVAARADVRLLPVRDIADLVAAVFTDETLVLGALASGYFGKTAPESETADDPVRRAATYLTELMEQRFWNVLEKAMLAGNAARAKAILGARMRFQAQHHRYPSSFGRRLRQLIDSIPPATRRIRLRGPLIGAADCIRVSQFAATADHTDVVLLFEVSAGKTPAWPAPVVQAFEPPATAANNGHSTLDMVLAQISEPALLQAVRQPIDAARACYVLERNMIDSAEEFNDAIAAFYLHLMRHVYDVPLQTTTMDAAPEALDLLARAFAEQGGDKAARREVRDALHGGLHYVLDVMTDRFAREQIAKHIHRVFKEVIDPLDFAAQKEITAALMARVSPSLSPEMQDVPAGALATHHERIISAYVRSLDALRKEIQHLRT